MDDYSVALTSTTTTFTYETSGTDPITLESGKTLFDPQKVEITVEDGKATHAKVEGPNVKKDGSHGQNWHDRDFYMSWRTDQMPGWLADLVAQSERRYMAMQANLI